jgi:hypothetical protein
LCLLSLIVEWSLKGKYIAVARGSLISILSSNFKERFSISLPFRSWIADSDDNCTVKGIFFQCQIPCHSHARTNGWIFLFFFFMEVIIWMDEKWLLYWPKLASFLSLLAIRSLVFSCHGLKIYWNWFYINSIRVSLSVIILWSDSYINIL